MATTSPKIRQLQQQRATLIDEAKAISAKASADNRDLTDAEAAEFDVKIAKIAGLEASIEREQQLEALSVDNDPKLGFKSFGEFASLVRGKTLNPSISDPRLRFDAAAPSTFGNEAVGADGGFIVPPEFSREIWKYSLGEDSFVPLTANTKVSGNSMVFPKDETTPWGTTGMRAYWQPEATAANATKPLFGTNTLRLHKLMALVPVTEELLADTDALTTYIPQKVGDSIRWKTNEAILLGTGAGQPKGALTGSGTDSAMVIVAKKTSQTATTVVPENIAQMISQLPPGSFGKAIWLINNDVLPALFTLTLGNYPIYLPVGTGQGGIISSPFVGTLMGRPVLVSQHAKTLGQQGDIMLLDFSYYRTITKASGVETAVSMHLYFDAAAAAFRVMYRIDGQPIISSSITPANGTTKLSPFLQLAIRS
jgi:HK97 family phage major capsid protein